MSVSNLLIDRAEILRAISLYIPVGQVTEIRVPDATTRGDRYERTYVGYFDNADALADAVATLNSWPAVYFIPNTVNPALLARANNRIRPAKKKGNDTGDTDITRRRWLLIDCDPLRPAGISSTDTEHVAAIDRARRIRDELAAAGWPGMVLADSGNGGHLTARVDLPAEKGDDLVERFLKGISDKYSDASVNLDTSVFNPARVWKLPGTLVCKGDHTADRPHRMARLIDVPDNLEIVPREMLDRLALPPAAKKSQTKPATSRPATSAGHDAESKCIAKLATFPRSVAGSGGHNALFAAACEVCRWGLSGAAATRAIEWFNSNMCDPAWSDDELQHKLEDAAGKAELGSRVNGERKIAGTSFTIDDTEYRLVTAVRAIRGKFDVKIKRGDDVLLASMVNPHKADDIDTFLADASKKLPKLNGQAEEIRSVLLQLADAKPAAAPTPHTPDDHPYRQTGDGIFYLKPTAGGEVPVQLTNFQSRIVADVTRDDGTESESFFEVEASQSGRTRKLVVSAARFASMNWATENLGAEAIVFPGPSNRDHARVAIQLSSPRPIPRRTVFSHIGWRKLDGGDGGNGGWVYLHALGGIGEKGFVPDAQVDLSGALACYSLPEPTAGEDLHRAIHASMRMLRLAPDPIIFPIWCGIWRAAMGTCNFGIHVSGATGSFKTETAALAQQHFGAEMKPGKLPGSWSSTDNAIEGLLFGAKDAFVVVDDFKPGGPPHEVAKWHARYDRIGRAQGNNSARGRMRADGTLRPAKPPRGLMLSTGEEIPMGQSLRARTCIIEVKRGDIPADRLTECQRDACNGLYAEAMAGFLRDLAGSYDEVQKSLRSKTESLRQRATAGNMHLRTPEIIANLAIGLYQFISFARRENAITEAEGDALWERGWNALMTAGGRQAAHQNANESTRRFIELLGSAIASGHAHIADREGHAPRNASAWGWRNKSVGSGAFARDEMQPQGDRVGWVDGDDVMLDPDASYRIAQAMAGGSGDGLPVSASTLRKRLDEKNILVRQGKRKELLSRFMLEGCQRSVLHLARGILPAQSTISTISTEDGDFDAENAENGGFEMVENDSGPGQIHHRNPPFNPAHSTKSAGDAENGGNGGSGTGEGPTGIDNERSDEAGGIE